MSDRKVIKYTVISVAMGTHEDKVKCGLSRDSKEPVYRTDIQALDYDENFDLVHMHRELITRGEHPLIGDTYTLTFEKDAKGV